ncbi:MAG: glucan biosynthesis protein D [Polyangiaceae bacterium UTPRO1]|jgi:glucans biosynthesis protein|nr:glucan biosynthesis protein G [Myxococcales bacterium]OQY66901.1 MAG: glucan biosynthesis protein D [Polyangiaceae bacterium UTPRO1]
MSAGSGAAPGAARRRRRRGPVLAALAALATLAAAAPAAAFDFDDVAARAEAQAQRPYHRDARPAPKELAALSYDQYRDIRYRPDHALWRAQKLPFEVMFFHLGKFQTVPVRINEVAPDGVRHIPYDRADFDYGKNKLSPAAWGDLGFAGFRVHYALNAPAYKDELVVFLGASYFRALGSGLRYGLSARGLALDTVGGQGEEFPDFTEFWLVRPTADARTLTIYALLDSPRASGAYRFEVHPGAATVIDVRARIFLRAPVATLGLAPLTSMYFFGENQPHRTDFRPEVHDSDGLSVATGDGEWLWRPLLNPDRTFTTSFAMRDLRGFGLMQRDRNFASYEDSEARYELRPSAWVEPSGSWGPGRVELVQLHTADETNDNSVAYWVPKEAPPVGAPLDFAYRLHWQGADLQHPPGGWVVQTRTGRGFAELGADERQFVVDFTGPALAALPATAPVQAVVTAPLNGEILESNAYRVEATGMWRMMVRVRQLQPGQPTELRGFLRHGKDVLTETWSDIVPP